MNRRLVLLSTLAALSGCSAVPAAPPIEPGPVYHTEEHFIDDIDDEEFAIVLKMLVHHHLNGPISVQLHVHRYGDHLTPFKVLTSRESVELKAKRVPVVPACPDVVCARQDSWVFDVPTRYLEGKVPFAYLDVTVMGDTWLLPLLMPLYKASPRHQTQTKLTAREQKKREFLASHTVAPAGKEIP